MNIYGLIVILLFLGQAHCERGKNYRCRKIQIFTSQFQDFANTDFHFLSQIAVSLHLNTVFVPIPQVNRATSPQLLVFFKASSLEMETFFSTFPRLGCQTVYRSLWISKSFVFFSSSVNQNGLFLNYSKKWVLCIRNRFHAKQHCVVLKIINLKYSIYNGLSIVFFSQN